MLLDNKVAVVYGGAGNIGSTAARAFAREGARVHIAGRTKDTLDIVAREIRDAGGTVEVATVDALDEKAVHEHMDAVAKQSGGVDICLNVIQHGDVQGTPMVDMDVGDYLAPVLNGVRTTFLTSTAAARHMRKSGGVILIFGGEGPRTPVRWHSFGGLLVGFEALETMRRQMATEFAADNIRVVTLKTSGIAESLPSGMEGAEAIAKTIDESTLTGKAATFDDVANAFVFAASDQAKAITGAAINITGGAMLD
jgi:3-oxoacyl-[acyl-carrier protein] reductase